ncbi:antitoxin Xre-like helix-turn-helix domain-containing protein [Bradyrhizobium sp. SYSU BS000235]|uniref:antitoxin Xre-like helix-turn-helix domain-containing protein n=1 Tax=Bradyrhizobium sp. SYSU BS000235 TaxID=3411332 RepID=UPI003C78D34A
MVQGDPRAVASPEVPKITTAEAEAMGRAVVKLLERRGLSDGDAREILGGLSASTYARWKAGDPGRIYGSRPDNVMMSFRRRQRSSSRRKEAFSAMRRRFRDSS